MTDSRKWAERLLSGFGWIVVVCAALAISTWSLYAVGRFYGLPPIIAGLVSASFDGAALTSADLSLKYARTHGDSGLAARLCVFVFAGASAWLNAQHASLVHDPSAARVMFAFPPVAAVVVFELQQRWIRRGALRAAGRVPSALPVFGRWSWVLFPGRTLGTIRKIVRARLDRAELHAGIISERLPELDEDSPSSTANPRPNPKPNPRRKISPKRTKLIRAWARTNGITVSDQGPLPRSAIEAWQASQLAMSNGHKSTTSAN